MTTLALLATNERRKGLQTRGTTKKEVCYTCIVRFLPFSFAAIVIFIAGKCIPFFNVPTLVVYEIYHVLV